MKQHVSSRRVTNLSETDERKPEIQTHSRNQPPSPPPLPLPSPEILPATGTFNEFVYLDTSDSVPRLHTDSSCSEHVVSPEFTCEVQSEQKLSEWDKAALDFQFNYLDATMDIVPPGPLLQSSYQMSPMNDMYMYLHKPF